MKKNKILLIIIALGFSLFTHNASACGTILFPIGGGSGTCTITGIIQGNGAAAYSPITVGTGLSFIGGTLSATGGGTVTSVSGTSNRITSTGGTTPVIDISASYVGQTSITTVGTLSTGAVPASLVTAGTFGSGSYTFPSDLIISGNINLPLLAASKVVFTDASKNLTSTGIGTSSQVLLGDGSLGTYNATVATSVSNSDGTLTISPTTGAVVASINLANANTWTVFNQNFTTGIKINGVNGISYTANDTTSIAIGEGSLATINAGTRNNLAIGKNSLNKLTTGSQNVALGNSALTVLTTGTNNFALGQNALASAVGASSNVALGQGALTNNVGGSGNIAIGASAMNVFNRPSGTSNNISIGNNSSASLTTGQRNIIIGSSSGGTISTGTDNLIIGTSVSAPTSNSSFGINIMNLIYGDSSSGLIGIGIFPVNTFDVAGGMAIGTYAGVNLAPSLGLIVSGKVGFGLTSPTALLHLAAGSASANTAPLKFNSGTLLTTAEAGAVEFLTDKYYGTITTGAARKEFTLNDAALTSGKIPVATTNGRITDSTSATLTTAGVTNVVTTVSLTAQGADIGTTTLTGTAGLYRVSYSLQDTTADVTAGAVVLTIGYTDGAGATTSTATQSLVGVGRQSGSVYVQLASGNLTYATTHTGLFGTAVYALYITLERVN